MDAFRFEPGQVAQLSVFGTGESTFVICSPPTRMDFLQFSVMRVGELTHRLHTLKAGDPVGLRGPLGNHFPYQDMRGRDIVFIGGGLGLAPLRTLLLFMLDNRADYGDITPHLRRAHPGAPVLQGRAQGLGRARRHARGAHRGQPRTRGGRDAPAWCPPCSQTWP